MVLLIWLVSDSIKIVLAVCEICFGIYQLMLPQKEVVRPLQWGSLAAATLAAPYIIGTHIGNFGWQAWNWMSSCVIILVMTSGAYLSWIVCRALYATVRLTKRIPFLLRRIFIVSIATGQLAMLTGTVVVSITDQERLSSLKHISIVTICTACGTAFGYSLFNLYDLLARKNTREDTRSFTSSGAVISSRGATSNGRSSMWMVSPLARNSTKAVLADLKMKATGMDQIVEQDLAGIEEEKIRREASTMDEVGVHTPPRMNTPRPPKRDLVKAAEGAVDSIEQLEQGQWRERSSAEGEFRPSNTSNQGDNPLESNTTTTSSWARSSCTVSEVGVVRKKTKKKKQKVIMRHNLLRNDHVEVDGETMMIQPDGWPHRRRSQNLSVFLAY